MVKHIVCYKLKDNSKDILEKAKNVFLSMKGKVPQVKDVQVGIDFLHSERSYDIVLEVILDDREALDDYQNDPYHAAVVKEYVASIKDLSISIDYEF